MPEEGTILVFTAVPRYPYASLNRTLFWTGRSPAIWHAPGIFVLYVYLAVFYRAPRDRDLNSIPKWGDTPVARGLRLQRGVPSEERGQPVEFRGNELATSQWMVPYVKTIKVSNSGSVLIVFNSTLTSGTSISTSSTYFILWVFLSDQSKLSGFRQKKTGHAYVFWIRNSSAIRCAIFLHFTKVYSPQ
jgi:hypothetical protein